MKILKDWINFAEEFEKHLGQSESKWRTKIDDLRHRTQIQLGLMELHKEITKPENSAEINDQIGYGHKDFDND